MRNPGDFFDVRCDLNLLPFRQKIGPNLTA